MAKNKITKIGPENIENVNKSIDEKLSEISDRLNSTEAILADIKSDLKAGFKDELNKLIENMNDILNAQKIQNDVTARLFNHISKNTDFNNRLYDKFNSKNAIKELILEVPKIKRILSKNNSIFIESGTTLALTSVAFFKNLKDYRNSVTVNGSIVNPLKLFTNNAMIYMISLFEEFVIPYLLPGKPNNPYNATYGDPSTSGECNITNIMEFLNNNDIETIFSTASFLDINYGTHVSSIPNREIKYYCNTYINQKKCQDVFIITSEKINNDIEEGKIDEKCRLVFDKTGKPAKELTKEELEAAKVEFSNYLSTQNVLIITGSSSSELCKKNVRQFLQIHPHLEAKYFPRGKNNQKNNLGCLAVITNPNSIAN